MLSADPTVPEATNGQASNRYSYAFNEPLSLADPSGYAPICFICDGPGLSRIDGSPYADYASEQLAEDGLGMTFNYGTGSMTLGVPSQTGAQPQALALDEQDWQSASDPGSDLTGNYLNDTPVWETGYGANFDNTAYTPWSAWSTSFAAVDQWTTDANNFTLSQPPSFDSTPTFTGGAGAGTPALEPWPFSDFLVQTVAIGALGKAVEGIVALGRLIWAAADSTPTVTIGTKIAGQMASRGWTAEMINEVVANPAATSPALSRLTGNAATAYFDSNGGYVVVEDITGDVVQISNLYDPNWVPDSSFTDPPK